MEEEETSEVCESAPKKVVHKYTVREVFDSLSFSATDCDDDFDGFLHIASDLNGEEVKIQIRDLIDAINREHITDGVTCWCNPRVEKVSK